MSELFNQCRDQPQWAADEIERLTAEVANRDRDWVLAIAAALGTDSGYEVPIIPEPEPFKKLFAAISEKPPATKEPKG